ncbi:hypothetical protein [Ancylobacter mangrovi]|uniref:hypothetical protein n=1 Tax=Ancylobacter mangrovi TaxID=2972472 RepID=UPI0021610EE8|nr:hypothetical protein [Ancylobacter mangrovi]MCS0501416.1 hypothetical protein [Ancylobacter mangrovi]
MSRAPAGIAPSIWHQSPSGRALDMVEPAAAQVDFAEIAGQLALVNRYAGASRVPVSVANHTLIADRVAVLSGATERLRALVLLHDCHETRIGEVPAPSTRAKLAIARQLYGLPGEDVVREVLAEEKRRHDRAIHEAAGIALPTLEEKAFIHHCDIGALATERKHFLVEPPMPWAREVEQAAFLRQRPALPVPVEAAEELHALFLAFLPGARAQSARAPSRSTRGAA